MGADVQNCGDSNKTPVEGMGIWGGDSGERVSSTTKNGNSSDGPIPQGRMSSPNTNSSLPIDQSHAASPRYAAQVKENGPPLPTQGAADSTTTLTHTPTPPPLKPAPSPFSTTSFPSLGQMPSLVPGAPAAKASPTPQPDREDASQSAYSKTAALVSPGPVTISWLQDSVPSVALSASVGFSPKAPAWGSQTEVRLYNHCNYIMILQVNIVFVSNVIWFTTSFCFSGLQSYIGFSFAPGCDHCSCIWRCYLSDQWSSYHYHNLPGYYF